MRLEMHIPEIQGKIDAAVDRGLRLGGEVILRESNEHIPIETGALERTGAADVEDGVLAVSYRDADYAGQAADQHENLEYRHDSGRNAKFLENAFNAKKNTVSQIVATQIRRAAGGAA